MAAAASVMLLILLPELPERDVLFSDRTSRNSRSFRDSVVTAGSVKISGMTIVSPFSAASYCACAALILKLTPTTSSETLMVSSPIRVHWRDIDRVIDRLQINCRYVIDCGLYVMDQSPCSETQNRSDHRHRPHQ
jgi:hypothetical protein